jgi:hypothetical protein
MPRLDGTGPTGQGPLTGEGRGLCVVRVPEGKDEPVAGFTGWEGRPLGSPTQQVPADLERLQRQVWALEEAVRLVQRRLEFLGQRVNRFPVQGA